MTILTANLKSIQQDIANICYTHNCKQYVELVAVSKTFSTFSIKELYQVGQRHFAENYILEFAQKFEELTGLDIIWHFIGTIQSNKIKYIANSVSWIESLEKEAHAIRINNLRQDNMPPLNILIQIKLGQTAAKHGLTEFESIVKLAQTIIKQNKLKLRGLMGVASATSDKNLIEKEFQYLKKIFDKLNGQGYNLDTLSMGMSNDYAEAIINGSTNVRIGSKIFGARN